MIWICAYRDWALDIYDDVLENFDNVNLIKSQEEFTNTIDLFTASDSIFFIGWSWIIPTVIVEKFNCICMHPSPLPKYRGGSPLQNQIINGERLSAVTFFRMTGRLDAGNILWQKAFPLSGNLKDINFQIKTLCFSGIFDILNNNYKEYKQDEAQSSYFKRRTPEMSEISIDDIKLYTAEDLHDKIRCLQDPYPNAFIVCSDGKKLYLKLADYEK
tara:strand:- start:380 stop:1024 length:645 start_codon:yes stop_codon:yes gene_type:complete